MGVAQAVNEEDGQQRFTHDGKYHKVVAKSVLEETQSSCLADQQVCILHHNYCDEEHRIAGVLQGASLVKILKQGSVIYYTFSLYFIIDKTIKSWT